MQLVVYFYFDTRLSEGPESGGGGGELIGSAGSARIRKDPSAAETVSCVKLVCTFVTTTFAPLTTAPLLSWTTPRTEPVTSARRVCPLENKQAKCEKDGDAFKAI